MFVKHQNIEFGVCSTVIFDCGILRMSPLDVFDVFDVFDLFDLLDVYYIPPPSPTPSSTPLLPHHPLTRPLNIEMFGLFLCERSQVNGVGRRNAVLL